MPNAPRPDLRPRWLRGALALLAMASLLLAPAAFARTFVLDGDLADWTDADAVHSCAIDFGR